jgi:type I restriction enzyme R subunit
VPKGDDTVVPPDDDNTGDEDSAGGDGGDDVTGGEGGEGRAGGSSGGGNKRVKYVVNDVAVYVVAERVQYYGSDGKLITESLRDYTRSAVRQQYASLDEFLTRWGRAEQTEAVIRELEEQGVLLHELAEQVGKEFDPFDLVCHVAFDRPPLTRRERAEQVRKRDYFAKYGEQARAVLDTLLEKYADAGIEPIESVDVLKVQPFDRLGSPVELIKRFGGKAAYLQAVRELREQLYSAA